MGDLISTALRSRLALAAGVALACISGCLAIVLAGTGPRGGAPGSLRAERPSVLAQRAVAAHRHGRDLGVPGLGERELRELETATLGPEHAREHAEMRAAMRGRRPSPERLERARRTAAAAAEEVGAPAEVGRWDFDATVSLPIVAIHAALLPTGKVMVFSYPQSPWENRGSAWLWDPVSGTVERNDPPLWLDPKDGALKPANIWCSGHTFTADGELVVFGGNLDFESGAIGWKGLNKVYTFNPFTETWREQPDMRHGRWYPTGVRLADGRIPITSGLDESGTDVMNEDVELFTPPSAPGGLGSVSLIGRTSDTLPGLPPTGGYYPHMFAMPSGRAFVVGPQAHQSWFMDTPGTAGFTWSDAPNLTRRRLWGTAVPLPGDEDGSTRIMALGGTTATATPSTTSTEVFDEANPGAGWQAGSPLVVGRGHANTVLLPDGSMVEIGGGVGSDAAIPSPLHAAGPEHRQVELWDPAAGEWRLGPAQAENRAYHSTALLLPDGRVLSAGDEYHGGAAGDTGEIYEPPYLFRGARPTIGSAPSSIRIGAEFGVETPDADVTRAVLVAPGSVTHAVDMNQRLIPLRLTRRTGCVDLVAPSNAASAPPGYYMLFLLNDRGVPSLAEFVKLRAGGAAPDPCDGSAPPDPPPPDPPVPQPPPAAPGPPPATWPPTATLPAPNRAPIVSRLRLAGTRIRFNLSERATVSLSFERLRSGRRTRRARLRTRLTHRGVTGANAIRFDARARGFPAGTYRLTARATDPSGRRSAPVRATFRVGPRGR
jgi:hypothetical protein